MTSLITSRRHPLIRFARSLQERRGRERERAFLLEGPKSIRDALASGFPPSLLFWAAERCGADELSLLEQARARGTRVVQVTEDVLRYLTATVTPQGVVAVFPLLELPLVEPVGEPWLILVVDGLQDPGNLGTLLRSALGAGVHAVFHTSGTVDPYNPKVLRAAASAHFRLPIREFTPEWRSWLREHTTIVLADPHASVPYDSVDWVSPRALVIGSEAHGISPTVAALAQHSVVIPLRGGLESLNAGIAGSIILFEAARQRRVRTPRPATRD